LTIIAVSDALDQQKPKGKAHANRA
jgi:hypothetical protein